MAQNRSRDDFLRFLDYLGDKGLVAKATAAARRTAASKILEVLSDDEAIDVTSLDVDLLMSRFDNLNPHQYTPESLQTYRSRFNKGLEDFRAYLENPISFRPARPTKGKREAATGQKKKAPQSHTPVQNPTVNAAPVVDLPNANVLPIPLRQNLTVRIFGLPFDLTEAEASKISNIVLAHATPGN